MPEISINHFKPINDFYCHNGSYSTNNKKNVPSFAGQNMSNLAILRYERHSNMNLILSAVLIRKINLPKKRKEI